MKLFFSKHKTFFLLFSFLIAWSLLLLVLSPEEIVRAVGIQGGYLIIFGTALVGVSGFTSAPFFASFLTFAASGEFHPVLLGLIAGPGRVLGDILFYYLGAKGGGIASDTGLPIVRLLSRKIASLPRWTIPVVSFCYTAFTPLPQDILMVTLGLGKAPTRLVFPFILLGNITFAILVAVLVSQGFQP